MAVMGELLQLPTWLIAVVAVSILLTVSLLAWRLINRLERIQHGATTLTFTPPTRKDGEQR